jgi:hypothetical protein
MDRTNNAEIVPAFPSKISSIKSMTCENPGFARLGNTAFDPPHLGDMPQIFRKACSQASMIQIFSFKSITYKLPPAISQWHGLCVLLVKKNGGPMNVKRLEGVRLNFWVAKAAGLQLAKVEPDPGELHDPDSGFWHPVTFSPSSDWSQGGPIIANDWFAIEDMLIEWYGHEWTHIGAIVTNPLQWFMRAYVATQFGDQVEDIEPHSSGASPAGVTEPGGLQTKARGWVEKCRYLVRR